MWFQQELPYPDVDLGSLKGSAADVFPREISEQIMPAATPGNIKKGEFYRLFEKRVKQNFECLGATDAEELAKRYNECTAVRV